MKCIFLIFLMQFLPLTVIGAEGHAVDPYAIPKDKHEQVLCRRQALEARPGNIIQQSDKNSENGWIYDFEIVDPHNQIWRVICNGSNQEIIRNEPKN